MSKIDKEIEALGFEIRVLDLSCGYIVYENKQSDSEIIIEWADDEEYCKIFHKQFRESKIGLDKLFKNHRR